jgi:collagen type VII alpha
MPYEDKQGGTNNSGYGSGSRSSTSSGTGQRGPTGNTARSGSGSAGSSSGYSGSSSTSGGTGQRGPTGNTNQRGQSGVGGSGSSSGSSRGSNSTSSGTGQRGPTGNTNQNGQSGVGGSSRGSNSTSGTGQRGPTGNTNLNGQSGVGGTRTGVGAGANNRSLAGFTGPSDALSQPSTTNSTPTTSAYVQNTLGFYGVTPQRMALQDRAAEQIAARRAADMAEQYGQYRSPPGAAPSDPSRSLASAMDRYNPTMTDVVSGSRPFNTNVQGDITDPTNISPTDLGLTRALAANAPPARPKDQSRMAQTVEGDVVAGKWGMGNVAGRIPGVRPSGPSPAVAAPARAAPFRNGVAFAPDRPAPTPQAARDAILNGLPSGGSASPRGRAPQSGPTPAATTAAATPGYTAGDVMGKINEWGDAIGTGVGKVVGALGGWKKGPATLSASQGSTSNYGQAAGTVGALEAPGRGSNQLETINADAAAAPPPVVPPPPPAPDSHPLDAMEGVMPWHRNIFDQIASVYQKAGSTYTIDDFKRDLYAAQTRVLARPSYRIPNAA